MSGLVIRDFYMPIVLLETYCEHEGPGRDSTHLLHSLRARDGTRRILRFLPVLPKRLRQRCMRQRHTPSDRMGPRDRHGGLQVGVHVADGWYAMTCRVCSGTIRERVLSE